MWPDFMLLNIHTTGRILINMWIDQYGEKHSHCRHILEAVPEDATADDVDRVFASLPFGSSNRVAREWGCDVCHGQVTEAVVIRGDEKTMTMCLPCVLRLVKFVQ